MRDNVLVKAIYTYKYWILKNVLGRTITLETYLEGFGNLRGFFSMNPSP
jgi:hypothetical protein